jgi:hypothetical protein
MRKASKSPDSALSQSDITLKIETMTRLETKHKSNVESNSIDSRRKRHLVLGCGALVYELVELIKHNPIVDKLVELHCLPATLHNTPQLIAGEVDKFLSKHAHSYDDVMVAYGDCGTAGALDSVLEKYQASRLPGAHCYEFFAGAVDYDEIIEEQLGSFFLTDFLVKFFDRLVIQGLGIDRYPELLEMYFKHYTQLVYIAQTGNIELQQQAQRHAKTLGLNYQYRFVGMSGLKSVIPNSVLGRIEVQNVSA